MKLLIQNFNFLITRCRWNDCALYFYIYLRYSRTLPLFYLQPYVLNISKLRISAFAPSVNLSVDELILITYHSMYIIGVTVMAYKCIGCGVNINRTDPVCLNCGRKKPASIRVLGAPIGPGFAATSIVILILWLFFS